MVYGLGARQWQKKDPMVQPLLAQADLLLIRGIKWTNLILGFEQENHYAIVDACCPQSPFGFINEQSNVVLRQVRRPIWFMNSTIYAEINGKLFTDAGQYVVHFGHADPISKTGASRAGLVDGKAYFSGVRVRESLASRDSSMIKPLIPSIERLVEEPYQVQFYRLKTHGLDSNVKTHHLLRQIVRLSPERLFLPHAAVQFGKISRREALTRDWLAQLWLGDKKLKSNRLKKRQKVSRNSQRDVGYEKLSFFQSPLRTWFTSSPVAEERIDDSKRPLIKQPPLSQSSAGFLRPATPEEMKVQPLLARANLLITRDIEWANLMLGFEQENRYAIVDTCYPQSLLRSRRPFIAYITDAMGNELFKEIGVVHRRWHLWRRVKKQFAVVENPGFWNWTFTLKDSEGRVLAEIDRDWRGIGFELFTDAGRYAIRFGHADASSKTGMAQAIQELEVKRPLTLSERAVAVALAVSLDNDYFSRHGGWFDRCVRFSYFFPTSIQGEYLSLLLMNRQTGAPTESSSSQLILAVFLMRSVQIYLILMKLGILIK
ncbi:hypothetical protein ACLOJK_033776 [Asimina triloba]